MNSSTWKKGDHRINIQGIALAYGTFSNIIVRYPGSAHDARIFRESTLFADLVGDNGYMLTIFLIKSLAQLVTDPEKWYQKAFLTTWATMERAFGQLQGWWNCLHK